MPMKTSAPPALTAYAVALALPTIGALSLFGGGWWTFSLSFLAFVIVPLVEVVFPPRRDTADAETYKSRARDPHFTQLLHLLAWSVFAGLAVYLWRMTGAELTLLERIGMTASTGTLLGAGGIVVAHELGHRRRALDRGVAQALLHASWYSHFYVEHNEGHHYNVATPHDAATARLGEGFWLYLPRVVFQTFTSALRTGRQMALRQGRSGWGVANPTVRMVCVQALLAVVCAFALGWIGLAYWFLVGLVGILHLELVDYIEHYGLSRARLADGSYEPVAPRHSWNSDHLFGRLLLFELPRHSDHHAQAARPYQALRSVDGAPQLPFGYPAMMILALLPPVWKRIMDPRCQAALA
jgi:alkane 1-monooxygenase